MSYPVPFGTPASSTVLWARASRHPPRSFAPVRPSGVFFEEFPRKADRQEFHQGQGHNDGYLNGPRRGGESSTDPAIAGPPLFKLRIGDLQSPGQPWVNLSFQWSNGRRRRGCFSRNTDPLGLRLPCGVFFKWAASGRFAIKLWMVHLEMQDSALIMHL